MNDGGDSSGDPRSTFAMRLGKVERRIVEAAAAQTGEPLGAYMRWAALEAARRELSAAKE